jgi:ABC-type transport system involved in cytochrome c biogenesis ATPase subunit
MTALLEVRGLCSGYGESQVLDEVSFSMGVEAVGILGRNGMGKTTLCDTLMGLVRPTAGEVLLHGERIDGRSPERIARAGISYVPQGRRLFASLTVDEHLAMLAKGTRGKRWTPAAGLRAVPAAGRAQGSGGADLSGGEQQMLSVGPGAAAQRLARADGRAVRGAGTHHRRRPGRRRAPPGRGGHRRAGRRAEAARCDRDGRAAAVHGLRPDRRRVDRRQRCATTPELQRATSAWAPPSRPPTSTPPPPSRRQPPSPEAESRIP